MPIVATASKATLLRFFVLFVFMADIVPSKGHYFMIHNIGSGTKKEDILRC
jgi:uncharacterized protein YijF (DUF1287 family)